MIYAKIFLALCSICIMMTFLLTSALAAQSDSVDPTAAIIAPDQSDAVKGVYDQYVECLERVYQTMDENYFRPVRREDFQRFKTKFDNEIYVKIGKKDEKSNFVCWRSAAYLVDHLKDSQDSFSAFFPPKAADNYEKKVLGEMIDLGITGTLTEKGYLVTFVEPRSDAFSQGLLEDDIILAIGGKSVLTLPEDEIQKSLTPLINTKVSLRYLDHKTQKQKTIKVLSQEYYKQSVFMVPVDVPGIVCLEIRTFNRKTAEDLFRFLSLAEQKEVMGLILDLRGNPGGPPLAAQEISAFFLPAGQEFAYFQKKGQPKAMLSVPEIADEFRFAGPVVILVNKDSGSSSELFSGVLQRFKRAVIMGTNTAGKVFLKSMFHYDDGSMLLLVTSQGHFADGSVFDFNGITPDYPLSDEKADLIHIAANYLRSQGNAENH